ncbi:MAG: hypothetical protein AAF495_09265 [Pseudomonadota bacterium]
MAQSWDGSLTTSDGSLDVALSAADSQAALSIEGKGYQVTAFSHSPSELQLTFLHRATAIRCQLKKQSGTAGYRGPCKTVEGGTQRGQMLVFPVGDAGEESAGQGGDNQTAEGVGSTGDEGGQGEE